MNRRRFTLGVGAGLLSLTRPLSAAPAPTFRFRSIDGGSLDTRDWRRKPVLVVITASLCGFSSQLTLLQKPHVTYGPRGLIILAVPSDSLKQEYKDAQQVKESCTLQLGVTLPMTEILPVKGPQAHPFYCWLEETQNFTPGWNFNKVLLDDEGQVIGTWGAMTNPQSGAIIEAFTPLLSLS